MKVFSLIIGACIIASIGAMAGYESADRSRADEIQILQGEVDKLESDLVAEKYKNVKATSNSVSLKEYGKVVDQYNDLVSKYNSLASTPTYTPSYSPIYCTSNTHSFTNTTYTNCY